MNEAYVMLNVEHKEQKNIILEIRKVPIVKYVKTVYGICDLLVILESENMQEIKQAIDEKLHSISGIKNLTTLITVN